MAPSKCRGWDFPGGLAVRSLPSNAGAVGSIPLQGTKILHASRSENQNIKQKEYCNKFNKDFENGSHKKKHTHTKKQSEGGCQSSSFSWTTEGLYPSSSPPPSCAFPLCPLPAYPSSLCQVISPALPFPPNTTPAPFSQPWLLLGSGCLQSLSTFSLFRF